MTILLDTCTLLWTLGDTNQLSNSVKKMMEGGGDTFIFSQISLIEIVIKHESGKLKLSVPPKQIPEAAAEAGLELYPLTNTAIFNLGKLPKIHRDPFDRLLIAEALAIENTVICTPDHMIHQYPVKTLW